MIGRAELASIAAAAVVLAAGWRVRWQLPPARLPDAAHGAEPGAVSTPSAGPRPWRMPRTGGRRRRSSDEHALATWCQHVARSTRTGSSLAAAFAQACAAVPEAGATFQPVLLAQQRGASLAGALAHHRPDDEAAGLVVATVRTCARLGGPGAEPLDRVAAMLHSRVAARAERRVHSSQAEMSAKVLTLLPVAVLGLLVATDGDVRSALGRAAVQASLAVGLVLNGLGWWWMRRIIAAPPRPPRGRALRRLDTAARELPEGIEVIVACLRAGITPAQLVETVIDDLPPPLRPAFEAVAERMRRGQRFADALAELPARIGPQAHGLADSMAAADRYGLALGPVLDRLAADATEARRRRGDADARRLPVRLSFPLVLTTLPSFVLIAIAPAVIGAISTLDAPAL